MVWGALWLGSVILAWFVGGSRGEDSARAARTGTQARGEKTTGTVRASREVDRSGDEFGKGRGEGGDKAPNASTPPLPEPIRYDEIKTAEEFSRQALAFIDAQLRRGPEGHRALLLMLSEWDKHEDQIEMLFASNPDQLPKLIYPWIRLIVRRESDVVAFVDTVFATAAETPEWFEAINEDSMTLITEMIGPILPGMTSEQTIARIRENLGKMLKKGEGALPEALAEHYDELSALHLAWAGPLGVEEARKLLLDSSLPAEEKLQVLQRTSAEAVVGIELAPILAPALREDQWDAIQQIKRFNLGARDLLALDEAVYRLTWEDEDSGWMVQMYIDATRRTEWTQQRPFIEEGVRRGGKTRIAMFRALHSLDEVPEQFVRQLLALSDLSDDERKRLEALLNTDDDG